MSLNNNSNRTNATVGVVLVNWNGAEHTIPCIESLLSGSVKPDRIIVVDNASQDGSPDLIARTFPGIELIRNEDNIGFTGANNVGIERLLSAGCEYIWILNNDTTVDADCLQALRDYMNLHHEVSACSGKILHADHGRLIWYAGATYNKWTLRHTHRGVDQEDAGQYEKIEEVPFISGCCMFIRRNAIEIAGMFDNHFFAYYEDADWCLRAIKSNLHIHYIPQAIIYHKVSATVNKLKKLKTGGTTSPFSVYITNRNRLYMIRKHSQSFLQICTAVSAAGGWFCYYAFALLVLFRIDKLRALVMAVFDGTTRSLDPSFDSIMMPRYLR